MSSTDRKTTTDEETDRAAAQPAEDSGAVNAPAQSPERAKGDMLPPSAPTPDAPGAPGLAATLPQEPATHRQNPPEQNPEPSEHWFPPVSD